MLFDFKLFFTNVPLEEVIKICSGKLNKISKPIIIKMNFKNFQSLTFFLVLNYLDLLLIKRTGQPQDPLKGKNGLHYNGL